MSAKLRVALVGGPMYDALYADLLDEVEVVVHADHLTLNAQAAELLAAGERIDVLSTHGKYAPSQRQWLHPLDELLDHSMIAAMEPGTVALCRDRDDLLCIPRNVDVRVLWWRTDRMDAPPDTFAELAESHMLFGFTGRGSGLFGLFFELVVGAGGTLFTPDGQPGLDQEAARKALRTIQTLGSRLPSGPTGVTSWHYDETDAALASGTLDCAAAWPGATAMIRSSAVGAHMRAAPYPAGPTRRVSYSGCHGWAIPTTCGDLDGAIELVDRLSSARTHQIEAAQGGIPARRDVLEAITPIDEVDAERLDVTRRTIDEAMITYPALERFPELEDRGAEAITAVLAGEASIDDAATIINQALAAIHSTS